MSARSSPKDIHSAAAFYKLLLNFYPTEHREEYGPWMVQLFQDMYRDAKWDGGRWGVFKVMVRMVFDTAKNAAIEHLDKKGLDLMKDSLKKIGPYEIKDLIGIGGISDIYSVCKGADQKSDELVVLKVLRKEILSEKRREIDNEEMIKLFFNEAKMLKKFDHPCIPKCLDYGEDGDDLFITMELIYGKDLDELITENGGPLPQEDVLDWGIQICDILHYLHTLDEPIIFRDVKPSNFMLDGDEKIHAVDFAIANPPGEGHIKVGTKGYAPPDQYRGIADPRCDVYGLGATLHHLLTGRDPRQEEPFTFTENPARSLNGKVSEALEAVLTTATQYDPEDRYQSMEEIRAALEACL